GRGAVLQPPAPLPQVAAADGLDLAGARRAPEVGVLANLPQYLVKPTERMTSFRHRFLRRPSLGRACAGTPAARRPAGTRRPRPGGPRRSRSAARPPPPPSASTPR